MSPRVINREFVAVWALLLIGLGLRIAYPSRMAVEHFDEGVYASNLYAPDGRYPFQHLYAPPLVPFCLEWASILAGPSAVMAINVVAGMATLLVVWGMLRQWSGPPAAIAALAFLALNEFHITYSRAALTDAMLCLWMTAGVWLGWRAILCGGPVNIALAGLFAALAWWTKYNGWLTLAITGSGTAGWILFSRPSASGGRQPPDENSSRITPRQTGSRRTASSAQPANSAPKTDTVFGAARLFLGRWVITAVIAFALWSPWLWALQPYGGYAAVAKNHAGYFTGLGQWAPNAGRQLRTLQRMFDVIGGQGFGTAIVLPLVLFPAAYRSLQKRSDPQKTSPDSSRKRGLKGSELRSWMATAWAIGLATAVPLYTPYPRLMLPLWIGFVVLLFMLCDPSTGSESPQGEVDETKVRKLRWALAAFVITTLIPPWRWSNGAAWADRAGLRTVATQVLDRLRAEPLTRDIDGARCIVSVVAEPGLFFHLAANQSTSPVGHVTLPSADYGLASPGANTSGLPAYLLIGPHADHAEADRLIAAGRLEAIAEFEYRPSPLVLLDSRPAWDLPDNQHPFIERIRLLHVKP